MQWKSVPASEKLPINPETDTCYRWEPHPFDPEAYWHRVDRNIGWLTRKEQEHIRSTAIAIAGCGGMGGVIAVTLARLGVGRLRIADNECFEPTNINRQFGASTATLGHSKALTTARMIRAVAPDCTVEVFPAGITNNSAGPFTHDSNLVIDEIDFWAIGCRIALHQAARAAAIPVIVGSSVGFGTRLFFFDKEGAGLETMLGLNLEEGQELERVVRGNSVSDRRLGREQIVQAMFRSIVPDLPDYRVPSRRRGRHPCQERLIAEGVASIVSTNPLFAAGFLANLAVQCLLGRTPSLTFPRAPGYVSLDAAKLEMRVVRNPVGSKP